MGRVPRWRFGLVFSGGFRVPGGMQVPATVLKCVKKKKGSFGNNEIASWCVYVNGSGF